jgi:hypothetical protein
MEEDVNMENISNVNAGTLSEMQKADDSKNTLPEKIVHQRLNTTFLRCCMCLFLGLLVLLRLCTGNSSE